ncbi:MAG: hypothetical protein H0X12_08855 [Nocardioides sp.]|nr:hypothetical protein [Nocardioides sp.]
MTLRLAARFVAAVILAAATGVSVSVPPAGAATCATSSGVSVVVDFGTLGGGVQTSCDAGGASKNAAAMLGAAGYSLTYVQRFPGFVCRINGAPADDPCVNTPPGDAYWGLFWSDGKNGQWVYSSIAAGGLRVPSGGYVGLAWQSSADRRVPGVPASVRPTPKPSPKPSPTPSPTKKPTPTPASAPTPSATVTPTPSATASKSPPKKKPTKKPTALPSSAVPSSVAPSSAESASPVSAPDSDAGDDSAAASAVPTWLVLAVLAALLVGGGAAIVVRRRGSPR